MKELVVLQQVEREGPGLFAEAAAARGWPLHLRRPWAGDPLPATDPADQILVVLGGPMGVADLADPAYPWLTPTLELLERRLRLDLPVIGVCLGAQLLARAAGGAVVALRQGDPPAPCREVGFGAIHLLPEALRQPVLRGLPSCLMALHWHGDRILLPPAAMLLGSTLPCPEQFFRLGRRAFGLQFHVEVTAEDLPRWLDEDAAFVVGALGPGGIERVRSDADRWFPLATPHWRRLIDNLLEACAQPVAPASQSARAV
ncbi:MAG: type 1 glutamine amidotransferase [Synechococcaceae cyanobacterium]|nr:type 1 glutamine amidotransferase [Synechococcaceae cyanobacterium]